jgi:hypothetical protein
MSLSTASTFANSEAREWLSDLLEESDVYFIHNTVEIVVDYPAEDTLESWDCCCALAAAEMVAAARGNPPPQFPMEASAWLKTCGFDVDEEVMGLALKAIERIESEATLKAELEDGDQLVGFQGMLTDLRRRLAA